MLRDDRAECSVCGHALKRSFEQLNGLAYCDHCAPKRIVAGLPKGFRARVSAPKRYPIRARYLRIERAGPPERGVETVEVFVDGVSRIAAPLERRTYVLDPPLNGNHVIHVKVTTTPALPDGLGAVLTFSWDAAR